ncbi:MAG TPA: hypothetical protein VN255_06695, partial [Mycobacterium sp.]|nr:hypothetical protein [Mycobacterium sp.]
MGTTLPHLDDKVRDYPEDDAWENDETDPYLNADYGWTGWPPDFRWRPVTAILGAVVAVGAIATAVIINSGDSASTKATVGPAPLTSAPSTPKTTAPPSTSPTPQLPRETVTTVTPPPSALPSMAPTPTAAPPPTTAPPPTALNPRTVV